MPADKMGAQRAGRYLYAITFLSECSRSAVFDQKRQPEPSQREPGNQH